MGKSNAAVKNWISVKERFADFYNGTVFDGRAWKEQKANRG